MITGIDQRLYDNALTDHASLLELCLEARRKNIEIYELAKAGILPSDRMGQMTEAQLTEVFSSIMSQTEYGYWTWPAGYGSLVDLMGENITGSVIGDYQGEELFVLRRGERYGYLVFGYGSCSGCDWFQSCDSAEDFAKLYSSMDSGIQWFDTVDALWAHVTSPEARGRWEYYSDEYAGFLDKVEALLS